ncbi:hypothetical protein BGZ65_006497 [Modicella reniformis]|uniref:Uncharacterized protein n=1 Tax=Modicella reniformis TaxID=1440133 RepID=A0A9P6IP80_9FUNG|nr:hypothetical protein BGZ65_006497 [Modicella reniformis]
MSALSLAAKHGSTAEDVFSNYSSAPGSNEFKPKPLIPLHIYSASDTDIDKKIGRCIVAGDFDSVINVCLHNVFRMLLFLPFAVNLSCWSAPRRLIFRLRAASTAYIRIFQSVMAGDLVDSVRTSIENDMVFRKTTDYVDFAIAGNSNEF